uniref:Mam-4 n=1 Tax=Pristionchus pacificus TaxID=54126 RepID=A0A2A6CAV5_PRIPA|eukprot:PDM75173.1 mam-4 [Pristionchus pacificus]
MKILLLSVSNLGKMTFIYSWMGFSLLLACISSTPAATTRALRARAKAATSVDDEEGLVELRTIASLYDFKDEPDTDVESGGRLTCSFDQDDEHCSWYNVQSGGVRFWINSEQPVLRLCAITMDNDFNCEEMAEWDVNAPISTSIPPSVDPFKLRIEVSGLTSETIVLIDNIRYEGQICELINDEVQITRDETTDFAILTNVDNEVDRPKKKRKPASGKKAIMGISMKKHRDDDTNQEEPIAAPPPPPSPENQERSEEEETSEDVVDEIMAPTLGTFPESETLEPVPDTVSVDVCEALACTFNEEHSCLYSLGGIGSTSSWTHAHDFIGNHLTGVQQNSPGDYTTTGFVYVGKNHKDVSDEVFVMESAKFTLRKSVQLSFDLFLRSFGPQLKVCIDSFDYCPYSSPSIDKAKFWYRNQAVFIPPGVRKPGYSHDSYSQPSAPVAPPPPSSSIPPAGSYSQGGLEAFSGKLTSGVATGEGTYSGSPPAAYAKYGKSAKQYVPYPGYIPPPAAPEDNQQYQQYSAPQPPPQSNMGLNLPASSNGAYPQLIQAPPNYQQSPVQYPQQQQQFASYVPQQAAYAQKLAPGQMFNGNSMVPHYQQLGGAAGATPPLDCAQLSLSNFPQCVENRPSIPTSESELSCTFEQGTTCRSDAPSGGFAYQLVSNPKGDEITLGTAITCQRGNGVLKLSYWLSNPTEIDFKVCTQDHLARSCTQPITYSSSSSVIVEVVHPNATVFDVEIVVANIIHPILFVVDSVEYKADLCEDEKQPAVSGSSKTSSSFFDDDASSSSSGAAVNVEKDRTPRGEEEEGETMDEKHEDQNRSDRAFHAHPPTLVEQQFQVDPAEYDHEAAMPASEDVAYENSITDDSPAPLPSRALKGPPRDPFKGVRDNEVCTDKPTFPPSAEPSEPQIINSPSRRLRIRRLSVCNLLDCSFERNMCNYANFMNTTGSFGPWSLGNKPVGNIHTGIKHIKDGAGFLYVGTDTKEEREKGKRDYVLESPSFILPEDTPLSFDVCFDTLMNCPYTVPPLEKEIYWKEGETVVVPKSARKIFFVATQKNGFKWLAIDNIQLKSDRC